MNKSQLSLSIENNAMYLVHMVLDDDGQHSILSKHEFTYGFDIYTDVLDTGSSKGMITVMNDLLPTLNQYQAEQISVSVNINHTKCVVSYVDEDLDSEMFKQECQDEAAKFLTTPEDYSWQAVPLKNGSGNPYQTVLLVFMPKRFINRLQMMILPSGKKINMIDGSHMALQSLLFKVHEPVALMEIEKNYLALSILENNQTESISYWSLNSETDIAYFAISELKKHSRYQTIFSTGSASTKDSMEFISNSLQKKVIPMPFPESVYMECAQQDCEKYFKAVGAGIKALNQYN